MAGSRDIDLALTALGAHARPNPDRLAACRAHREKEVSEKLQEVEQLLGRGKASDAWTQLKKLDLHYAGVAAPKSIELAQKLYTEP